MGLRHHAPGTRRRAGRGPACTPQKAGPHAHHQQGRALGPSQRPSRHRGAARKAMTKLGKTGPEVSTLALGCMGMSGMYGASDRAEGIATIHAAIERGITLLDTGDFYGMG